MDVDLHDRTTAMGSHEFEQNELESLVRAAVNAVRDPELFGVTLHELGVVRSVRVDSQTQQVIVMLTPTFLGCPAQALMESDVVRAVKALDSPALIDVTVVVRWVHVPVWTPGLISDAGRARLQELGIAVPGSNGEVRCPFCAADQLSLQASVGSTACRSTSYCESCRNVVEVMRGPDMFTKPVALGETRRHAHI